MCLPVDGEVGLELDLEPVEVLGERYGGPGLSGNSGGVRCGLRNGIQIKGIGKNLLAGLSTDYWHTHGACSIQDCIKETFWGEVLNDALPFGAARAVAIVDCKSQFAVEIGESKSPGYARRALLLRQPVLRPAHFMRSIFARPSSDLDEALSDVERTRAAIKHLAYAIKFIGLNLEEGVVPVEGETQQNVIFYLCAVARRAAAQLAASRAKRIIHGSLIASNYSMDGRWLDFGTTSATAGFGRLIVAPGSADFWRQEEVLLDGLTELAFYLSKFYLDPLSETNQLASLLIGSFNDELEQASMHEFLKLSGVSDFVLQRMSRPVKKGLWAVVRQMLKCESRQINYYYGDDRHQMPIPTINGSLNWLFVASAVCPTPDKLEVVLRAAGFEPLFCNEWIRAYWMFRSDLTSVVTQSGIGKSSYLSGFLIRCAIANIDNSDLFRKNLDARIDNLSKFEPDRDDFQRFTDRWVCLLSRHDIVDIQQFVASSCSNRIRINERLYLSEDFDKSSLCCIVRAVLNDLRTDSSLIDIWASGDFVG